jgi:1-acyl-sn-glycerol-3-phosphate acyltransferase
LIDREDRRSQLRTFKEGIAWLKKGVPLMAFPEGKRSKDGRLMEFKGGLFSMAVKTKVPIVPITICNAHAIMPSYGLLPVQRGAGKLHVHVHEAIDTDGKTEAELGELVRAAFLSQLPLDQHPLAIIDKAVDNVASPPIIDVITENAASSSPAA